MPVDKRDELAEKLELIERSILDLGTEIFHLRQKMGEMAHFQEDFLRTMLGLKEILDEKGLLSKEDFDDAIDLQNIIKQINNRVDLSVDPAYKKTKKVAH